MRSQHYTDGHAFPPFAQERLKEARHVTVGPSFSDTSQIGNPVSQRNVRCVDTCHLNTRHLPPVLD